jgi:hypothetical protein
VFDQAKKSANRVASERLVAKVKSSWIQETFRVSPDSRRMACMARVRKWLREKWSVVVDGKEEKPYDAIVAIGGRIVFDSAHRLHYLAVKGDNIYLVEERIE